MIALWIGIFIFIQAIVLIFVLALCKASAIADREIDRAYGVELKTLQTSSGRTDQQTDPRLSADFTGITHS